MGRVILTLGALVALSAPLCAETVVSANVLSDAVWTPGGSPYIITRDIRVRYGATLTIEAGTEVRFERGTGLSTDAGSSIVADGSAAQRVLFTSNASPQAEGDWDGVRVYDSPGSSFTESSFRYALTCLELNVSDSPVDHCRFRTSQIGLSCLRSTPMVDGCTFSGLSSAGLYCWGRESEPRVTDSNFTDNVWNVYLSSYTSPQVVVIAERNWWGVSTGPAIAETIYDGSDNPSVYGVVDYDPWLAGEGVEDTSWGVIKALFKE
jgi:hypothetical protein